MSRNPYAPPDSPVADADALAAPPIERPRTVVHAMRLIWVALALNVVTTVAVWGQLMTLAQVPGNMQGFVKTFAAIGMGLSFAIYLWILAKMYAGRNWARIVLLVFTVMGLLSNPFGNITMLGWTAGLASVLAFVLQLAAVVLLFMPASRPWFNQPRARGG